MIRFGLNLTLIYCALLGYNITLRVDPIALGGRLFLKTALTTPLFP
jgi:hypothetical protein